MSLKMLRNLKNGRNQFGPISSDSETDISVLEQFLRFPLWNTNAVFGFFETINGAIFRGNPDNPKERFLFIEGHKQKKVVLVAHADTVWDRAYGYGEVVHQVIREDNSFTSTCVGLGADDRAGCAMLWLLKESGHSILITDGEERGAIGSRWLMDEHKDLASKLNSEHQFMIQLDRRNGQDFKCYDVGNDEFREFIASNTGYSEPNRSSLTDICTLCQDICGVNFSVGYYNEHSSAEFLNIYEWVNTLMVVKSLISMELPRFERSI